MLFKDINQQANEIFEYNKIQTLSEKSKFDNFKSSVSNDVKKVTNFTKDLFDDGFDAIIDDGKKSSDEREKIKNSKALSRSKQDIEKRDTKDDKIIIDPKVTPEKEDKKSKSRSHDMTLTTKDQVRLEKNIFNQDIRKKRLIYKSLLKSYNEWDNSKNRIKTEAFDHLSIERKLLSNQELIKILDYINNAHRRIKGKLKESIILEVTDKKLKNNIVSKEWKKRGSKRDKDNLVKLMKFFKLNDMQIFTAFDKIDKPLTYDELKRLNIDIKHTTNMSVTKQDLEKLVHTLGKFKLKNFLIKLKNDIQKSTTLS